MTENEYYVNVCVCLTGVCVFHVRLCVTVCERVDEYYVCLSNCVCVYGREIGQMSIT
jgi:hypothetical protein